MIRRWRTILALVLGLVALDVTLSAMYPRRLHATVLVVPIGKGDELDINLWGPSPDVRVVVWHQTVGSNHRLAAFTVPGLPLFCMVLGLPVGQWQQTGLQPRGREKRR